LAEVIAWEMGADEEGARALGLAAVLHDIGKIRVPDSILASPGKLAPDQWDVMRQHTIWGASFLLGHEGFELATKIARSHHERWDGTGYPDGLSGNDIPEGATVVTVADAFDAMTHDRPYRAAQPVDEAIKEIVKHAGKQFNPAVVDALQRIYRRNELPVTHPDTSSSQAA
jgi:putative two-component system response regulator